MLTIKVMNSMNSGFIYRSCKVDVPAENADTKEDHYPVDAYFHRWYEEHSVIDPSPMIGGHPGGQISRLYGVVEFRDGRVELVHPNKIRFTDGRKYDPSKKEA